jgi:hypothetical protein
MAIARQELNRIGRHIWSSERFPVCKSLDLAQAQIQRLCERQNEQVNRTTKVR